jgi:hypothetical protein
MGAWPNFTTPLAERLNITTRGHENDPGAVENGVSMLARGLTEASQRCSSGAVPVQFALDLGGVRALGAVPAGKF